MSCSSSNENFLAINLLTSHLEHLITIHRLQKESCSDSVSDSVAGISIIRKSLHKKQISICQKIIELIKKYPFLLKHGFGIDSYTILHYAVIHHYLEFITELLDLGADPNFKPSGYLSPLELAGASWNLERFNCGFHPPNEIYSQIVQMLESHLRKESLKAK